MDNSTCAFVVILSIIIKNKRVTNFTNSQTLVKYNDIRHSNQVIITSSKKLSSASVFEPFLSKGFYHDLKSVPSSVNILFISAIMSLEASEPGYIANLPSSSSGTTLALLPVCIYLQPRPENVHFTVVQNISGINTNTSGALNSHSAARIIN